MGKGTGVDADVAGTGFRQTDLRSLESLPEGLRPPARFLERFVMHVAKNALAGTAIRGQASARPGGPGGRMGRGRGGYCFGAG
jgi:hypothetical protein